MEQENQLSNEINEPKLSFQRDTTKSLNEQAKDYVSFVATEKAVEDNNLVDEITDKRKQELKLNADKSLKNEKAESKKADVEIQKADFENYQGVATYAGIKKPLPNKMQKCLFTTLAFFQMLLLIVISIPTSIINILADSIDSIVSKLSSIAKSARVLVISLISLGIISAIIYIIWQLIEKYNVL